MDNLKRIAFEKLRLWNEERDNAEIKYGIHGSVTMYCAQIANAYFALIVESGLYEEYQEWIKERG